MIRHRANTSPSASALLQRAEDFYVNKDRKLLNIVPENGTLLADQAGWEQFQVLF
jgi:hypothetical protein